METMPETQPMKSSEYGKYVCVHNCQRSPHITILSDGVWVRSKGRDSFNPDNYTYSSAHRECYEAEKED